MIGQVPANVAALILYGSRARGDGDDASDTDVAVFSYSKTLKDLEIAKRSLVASHAIRPDPNYSVYSTATAIKMAQAGSLFLWHLRLEGRVLYEEGGWLGGLWEQLRPYSPNSAIEAVDVVETVVTDIVTALICAPTTAPFDAATLFSMIRTLGMVVGLASGRPAYGRRSSVERLQTALGSDFTLTPIEMAALESARLRYSGKSAIGSTDVDTSDYLAAALKAKQMIAPIRQLLDQLSEVA